MEAKDLALFRQIDVGVEGLVQEKRERARSQVEDRTLSHELRWSRATDLALCYSFMKCLLANKVTRINSFTSNLSLVNCSLANRNSARETRESHRIGQFVSHALSFTCELLGKEVSGR